MYFGSNLIGKRASTPGLPGLASRTGKIVLAVYNAEKRIFDVAVAFPDGSIGQYVLTQLTLLDPVEGE